MGLWTPPPLPSVIEQSARVGTAVVSSASLDTKGAWTSVIASTVAEAHGIWLQVWGQHVAATVLSSLIDIGVGPTDPPAIVVPDYLMAGALTTTPLSCAGRMQFFPVHIEAGSKVWVRHAANTASKSFLVKVALEQGPPFGDPYSSLENVTAYGATVSGSKGINVTSGAAVYGTQVQIAASTSKAHKAWIVSIGMAADTTILENPGISVQLLIGSGTTGPIGTWDFNSGTNEVIAGPFPPTPIWQPVPSGTRIDARIMAATTGAVHDVCAYGLD